MQAPDASSETGWSPIDTTLGASADGLIPVQTEPTIQFASGSESAPLAEIEQDGTSLSLSLDGDLPAPDVEGDTATYRDVLPGVDATLQALPQGFEESFIVDSPIHAPATLDIPIQVDGATAELDDSGALVLTDSTGAVVGGADPAVMWGAATDPATGAPLQQELVASTLVDGPDGQVLKLSPDLSFFTDPAVTYPVIIDPAVSLSLLADGSVDSSNPDVSASSATALRVGHVPAGNTYRSYLRFDASPIALTHVLSATLNL